jgi:hypothetical protein
MGTAHGTEELGLYSHGLACQASAWGHYIGFCLRYFFFLGYGHIWTQIKSGLAGKKILRGSYVVTLSHDEILTKTFLLANCRTLQMQIAISCERIIE